ncbi:MAG: hypothetical protein RL020_142 [Pseudomonadota bacterium]|jgi:hypothetical protein
MIRRFGFVALLVLSAVFITGCAAMQIVSAHFASTEHFIFLAEDKRIRYEPGAEKFAALVKPSLDRAIQQVEVKHYLPFSKPVAIFVCNSAQSFARLSGQKDTIRGGVHPTQGLFLNPVLLGRPETIAPVLTHELSHLHLNQRHQMNFVDYPTWFNEGLATFVADGSGAEAASEVEAKQQIANGKIFPPQESGSRLSLDQTGALSVLPNGSHMFYRQSMMFIGFLKQRDEKRFKQFLLDAQDGEIFSAAFSRAFGGKVESLQNEFISALKKS